MVNQKVKQHSYNRFEHFYFRFEALLRTKILKRQEEGITAIDEIADEVIKAEDLISMMKQCKQHQLMNQKYQRMVSIK